MVVPLGLLPLNAGRVFLNSPEIVWECGSPCKPRGWRKYGAWGALGGWRPCGKQKPVGTPGTQTPQLRVQIKDALKPLELNVVLFQLGTHEHQRQ